MDISRYFNLLSVLEKADTVSDIISLCNEFCRIVDVPYYMLIVLDQVPLCTPEIKYISNISVEKREMLLRRYSPDELQGIHRMVQYLFDNQAPVRWGCSCDEARWGSGYSDLSTHIKPLGLSKGFSIPIKATTGEVVIFSMAVDDSEGVEDALDEALPLAHTFVAYLLSRFVRLMGGKDDNKRKLTPREIDCLFWACEGKTAWEISKIIDVSERTVLFHLNNSTKKLSACNRQHAVALATSRGLVRPDMSRVRVSPQVVTA